MWIDFHVHGKLTKKRTFQLDYLLSAVAYAKEIGLNAFVLTEHFNTKDFYQMYETIKAAFPYTNDHYVIDGFKLFTGLEIDVANGGHVLVAAPRDNILTLRRQLDLCLTQDRFISFKNLLDMAETLDCLTIGAHPFRGEHPLALKQDVKQLKRLDALDLNATDIFNKGLEETQKEVFALAKALNLRVVTGSDTHYPLQLGSVKTNLLQECTTVAEIRQCLRKGNYRTFVSDTLEMKVFASKTTKSYLKSV